MVSCCLLQQKPEALVMFIIKVINGGDTTVYVPFSMSKEIACSRLVRWWME